jgi:DeoR family transcriptional regulator of aga operon
VASALFRRRCKVILLGGELRTKSMDLVGPVAEKTLEEYHVDYLVSGCDGAFADYGFYTSDMSLSKLEQKTISIADRTAVITESAKFGKRSLTRFAPLDDIDLLVTDTGLTAEDELKLRSHDIEVIKTEC